MLTIILHKLIVESSLNNQSITSNTQLRTILISNKVIIVLLIELLLRNVYVLVISVISSLITKV